MQGHTLKTLTGRIIVVQEDRFRMVGDSGAGYLFAMSRKSWISAEDLLRWHRENLRLKVHYEGESHLDTAIVHRIAPA